MILPIRRLAIPLSIAALATSAAACSDSNGDAPDGIQVSGNDSAADTTEDDDSPTTEPSSGATADHTTDTPADATTGAPAADAEADAEASGDDATDDGGDGGGGLDADAGGDDGPAADAEVPAVYQGALAAMDLAVAQHDAPAFELDEDDGVWEVTMAVEDDEWEVLVSSDGSEILGSDRESDLGSDDREALQLAQIDMAEAVRIAIAAYGGESPIDAVDFDDDEGEPYSWNVEFDDDVEVYVDIVTGDVLTID